MVAKSFSEESWEVARIKGPTKRELRLKGWGAEQSDKTAFLEFCLTRGRNLRTMLLLLLLVLVWWSWSNRTEQNRTEQNSTAQHRWDAGGRRR